MTTMLILIALFIGLWIGFGIGMITIGLMMGGKDWW